MENSLRICALSKMSGNRTPESPLRKGRGR